MQGIAYGVLVDGRWLLSVTAPVALESAFAADEPAVVCWEAVKDG